ncbi:flagellar hook-associated protein 3 FlgL [Rhodobacter viridis]|uniref:Flagellar hook-associated protein 3 FlgL n=1 Tax=Rhodobacter viridis TaxID=1054202 RepID=A0A318U6C4_9RHOB|nr:flagellin [Rhodobacter viridis]PYF11936.1 flagellar hook-associated protein 3 FlgL [Rhodobacter viridis]
MKYISVGDMSQTYLMRRHNVQLKSTISRLSDEMISGISQDLGTAVGGDFTALAAIDRSIARGDAYKQVATETDLMAGTQQDALEMIQGHAEAIGSTLVSASFTASYSMIDSGAQNAAARFSAVVDALNVNVAGRYVFSGTTTDTKPVASTDTIISGLEAAIGGLNAAEDIVNAVDDWFDAAVGDNGYLDQAYIGSADSLAPVRLSETDTTQLTITAADPTIRNMLKGFAMATLVARDLVPSNTETRALVIRAAGERITAGQSELTNLSSELGTVEGIISDAQTRNSAQQTALGLARKDLIGVDDYESATALEAAQSQMQTLYTLTSRLTKLSLTDYL